MLPPAAIIAQNGYMERNLPPPAGAASLPCGGIMKQLEDKTLSLPANGINLEPGTLRDQLAGKPNLLVFLRHFG